MILQVQNISRVFLSLTLVLVGEFATPIGRSNEQVTKSPIEQAKVWLDGLADSNYRVRRESFLKLCDRSVQIDDWLAKESKSEDQYRSAIALWLMRLRKSSGTPAERLAMLSDLEALKKSDDSVLDRYISEGLWEQLIELVGLLDPFVRNQLLGEGNRIESIVDQAWKTHNEKYVPQFLNLVLKPTERVYVNRWWRKLGLPHEWAVDDRSSLPSVQIARLEVEGKIDEAVAIAKKSGILNYIERLLIRTNRWDDWMALDTRRIPVLNVQNFYQQKAVVLISLGRIDEAEALWESIEKPTDKVKKRLPNAFPIEDTPKFANGNAMIALAIGRTDEFDEYLDLISKRSAFGILRGQGDIHRAFEKVGLDDFSMPSVADWLESFKFDSKPTTIEIDENENLSEIELLDYADFFFQVGLNEQGKFIDDFMIQKTKEQEIAEGISVWVPLFRQWVNKNDRAKAIQQWTEFLVRDINRTRLQPSSQVLPEQDDSRSVSPFRVFYRYFPSVAALIYEHLLEHALLSEVKENAVRKAVEQIEDLHFGRMPKDWTNNRPLVELRNAVVLKAKATDVTSDSIASELAELFDVLGETRIAIETLDMLPSGKSIIPAKAEYLARLGQLDAAGSLLTSEFEKNAMDLGLLLDCTDNLEKSGRFSEMDRYRIQRLSSVGNIRTDVSGQNLMSLPVRREVQLVTEQLWLRDGSADMSQLLPRNSTLEIVRCLANQYGEAAKDDLSKAKVAANFARVETIEFVKHIWPREKIDFIQLQFYFSRSFRSFIFEAIGDNNRELADTLFRVAYRCNPQDIDMPIVVIPMAEKAFGKELADTWFNLYYQPMISHMKEFPNDTLIGNNTAWMAATCNRNLETAWSLATTVTSSDPNPTYLDTLAEIEYRRGNVQRAKELSETCRRLEPREKHHREQLKRFNEGRP